MTSGFTLWRDDLPPWMRRDQITLPPLARRDCSAPAWKDCLIVVEDGEVVLFSAGGELPLPQGSVFALTGIVRPVLHNRGPARATLTTARRIDSRSPWPTRPMTERHTR